MDIIQKIMLPGIFSIILIVTGLVMSYLGKPYQVGVFTLHKLIALATIVIFVLFFKNYLSFIKTQHLIIMFLTVGVISIISLFVTGALLSIGNTPYALTKTIHSLAPFAMIISLGICIYLLLDQ